LRHVIKEYALEQGALEIQYIEEFFGEFPRRKTAVEIVERLQDREHLIHMIEAPLPEEPSQVVPVAYKVGHAIRAEEDIPKLADLVKRLNGAVRFDDRKVLYAWIGGTRSDWRGKGFFRALSEEQETWAYENGFHEIVVKTKNKFYEMRGTLDNLHFEVVKFEPHPTSNGESKVYLSKKLDASVLKSHKLSRTVVKV
jgi:GNAT superfamily N-acetyltransferase